jgi:23S rRNA pseudouridine1911/1915/1917 synthase
MAEEKMAIKIVSEGEDYLVIEKPAGLAVHGGGNLGDEKTLADWLIERYPEITAVGDDPIRPGIVHRLDKEVSGLMVVAKNQASFEDLKRQFQERTIKKEYLVLVHGQVSQDAGTIDFPITRSRDGYRMAAMPGGAEELLRRKHPKNRDQGNIDSWLKAKEALTEFEVKKRFVNFTFLKAIIKTGRTHQIRVHFYAYGHPVVGDPLYNTKRSRVKDEKTGINRIFLASCLLGFNSRDGVWQEFQLPLPEDLENFLPKN